jgi:hypothetical protein
MDVVWGAVLAGCGIFIAVYGALLFRFVLVVIGFALGFGAALVVFADQDAAPTPRGSGSRCRRARCA